MEVAIHPKVKDFVKSCFKNKIAEFFLIILYRKNKTYKRLVPNENLYPYPSYRYATRDHVKYKLDLSDVIGHSLYFFNHYYAPLDIFDLMDSKSIVIDVGANIGTVALRAASICREGYVSAFEPDPHHIQSFEENLKLNQFTNVRLFQKALGSQKQNAKLSIVGRKKH
jgi:hypothetical protein